LDEDFDQDISFGEEGSNSDTISLRAKVGPKNASSAFKTLTA